MNITPHAPSLSIPTAVNLPTEGLRRENHQREATIQVGATNPSAAEKGAASDKERSRTPAQANEQVDFSNLRKHAEHASASVNGNRDGHNSEQGTNQEANQQEASDSSQDSSQDNPQNKQQQTDTDTNNRQEKAAALAEQKVISQLQNRDLEVRQHELAHASTGGSVTGAPSYSFEMGPDGKKYAVSGEVSVDLSTVSGDPHATITKMQKVHAAALAPASPSAQDTRVAASASQAILQAQSEILELQSESSSPVNRSQNSSASTRTTFNEEQENVTDDFDTFINQTLSTQEKISPHSNDKQTDLIQKSVLPSKSVASSDVQLRSQRIESYYFNISQGYEKPDNFQFELTA